MADAASEALAVLERVQAPDPPEPADGGPTIGQVAAAMCDIAGRDPGGLVDVDDGRAQEIRGLLGLHDRDEISNLVAATAHVIEARMEDRWRDLDAIAKRAGWDRADFATAQRLHHNEPEFVAWEAGRSRFDPTFTPPPPPDFGSRTPATFTPAVDSDRLMDAGLREAARASRQAASTATATRGVEIRIADASINRY